MEAFRFYFHSGSETKCPRDPEMAPTDSASPNASTNRRPSSASSQALSINPSLPLSPRAGLFPDSDFRSWALPQIIEIKCDVMANWLYAQQAENLWCQGEAWEGVVLKKTRDSYTSCPKELMDDRRGFFEAVRQLNVRCAMTVNTQVIRLFLRRQELSSVPLTDDLKVQIIPSITHLPQCQKHHFAAFIQDTATAVVWDDDPRHIVDRVRQLEQQFMAMIWKRTSTFNDDPSMNQEISLQTSAVTKEEIGESSADDFVEKPRKIVLIQPFLSALTLFLLFGAIGLGFRAIAIEIKVDGGWGRLAFLTVVPLQMWFALFFMQSFVVCIAQIIGPTNPLNSNTKFFSGKRPRSIRRDVLPHVTIQCPVHKEGLCSVIRPTVMSVKAAISKYEMQGGSANIFINDDGMQLISKEDAQARKDFYDEHNIGWVARPKDNPKPTDGSTPFIRAGKFKKASNMNYALDVSVRIEDKLRGISRCVNWTQEEENEAYNDAFQTVIEEDQGRTWAEGNVRIGDYILLIDSDTRVPPDCLLDAVSEMESSPEVAITQFVSGVMNVTDTFFEKGITFFTNLVYTAIRFAVAYGDVAPFVGHNAILRWSAIQDIVDLADGREKYWSESTVSEDFDMALRLQCSGYIVRLGAYTGTGFKEGVSLTVYDELARWEKYAYGCSELIFHPLKDWPFKGPFTPLFRRFILSGMPFPSKLTIMAYVGTYYALASSFFLTLANYFIVGWFNGYFDHYYLNSFKIYFAIVVVFTGLGNVALAILRYRIGETSLFSAVIGNFKWIPLLTIFLGGVSLHLFQAIFAYLLSIDKTWGATSKEATETNFFEELPKVFKNFKWTFLICFSTMAMMIIVASGAGGLIPYDWRIQFFTAVWPLATIVASHIMLPIVLNPGLMLFMW